MGVIIVLLILGGAVYFFKVYNSPNAKAVRELCSGKNPEQVKVIEYFVKKGCMARTISDEAYMSMVREKCNIADLKSKALSKIGLDEDEVKEINPAMFEGFVFNNAYAKKRTDGKWVSSSYQVSWLFFSSTQVYIYRYTINMDLDNKNESTDEFFYKDVTSFSTSSETEQARGLGVDKFEVETNKFYMVVPGDKLYISMDGVEDSDNIIQAMKQKLREKKS